MNEYDHRFDGMITIILVFFILSSCSKFPYLEHEDKMSVDFLW